MKVNPIVINSNRALNFKGQSEDFTVFSYDQDYDETLKEGEYKMPYRCIYLSDTNHKIDELKEVTDIPAAEFLSDNLYRVLRKSSHYKPNSSIQKVKEIPENREKLVQKVKNQKIEKQTGKSVYSGKIYFADMDEMPSREIMREHNMIVLDKRPEDLNYQDLRNRYIDKKNILSFDKELKNQKRLSSIIDYYTRKKEIKAVSENTITECKTKIKNAKNILKIVKQIDNMLLEKAQLKYEKTPDNENLINIIDAKVLNSLSRIKAYYDKNMPNNIKANFDTTRYM